jgi:PAS domain S-box-containing protein
VSSEQPIRGDGSDRTLPTSEHPKGSHPGTPEISKAGEGPNVWNLNPEQRRDLLDQAPSGFIITANDGSILYSNKAFLDLVERDAALVSQCRIQDLLTPGAAIFYETQFLPTLHSRHSLQEISFDFRKPDGGRVAVLVNAALKFDGDAKSRHVLLSVFGAKQRRLYEAELLRARRESEEISEVVRRSSDAILRISTEGRIENWNTGAEQIFGYPPKEAIGRSLISLVSDEYQESFSAIVEEMKSGQEVVIEITVRSANGDPVDVSIKLSPHLEAPGTLVAYSAIIRNVTDRKRAEKALLQTEKLASVGRLASSIAHEINNPLEAVTNLLYILSSRNVDADTKMLIHTAQEELMRVSEIATHTLRFHKQSSNRTEVDLRSLFDSLIALYRARLVNSGIRAINDAGEHPPLLCFEGEIRQVLLNLVSNAFDAMRTGGILTLRSRRTTLPTTGRECIRITIADTGTGMETSVMRRLFEPFFSTKGIGGTGLGLWIVKDLVEKSHGSIKVRSAAGEKRSGTVVTILLPRIPA